MKFDGNLILIAFSRDSACEPDALSDPNECAVLRPEIKNRQWFPQWLLFVRSEQTNLP